ncbi:MAG: UDP-N-acetylenolpyruvoylglucosamine reductase [Desulfuromonas sp.]|nr:MAG: UDP-N-acetylenolpyruvoylglucosamine reductase [Desulfuromonas sp.]
MNSALLANLQRLLGERVRCDEPLACHTTWGVGGTADYYLEPQSRRELLAALKLLSAANIPWYSLGGGSNLLVRDGGIRGAVIATSQLTRIDFSERGVVRVEAGAAMTTLVRQAAERGLCGLESFAGLPGSIGGAVVMNAGAGGHELGEVVSAVTLAGEKGEEIWDHDCCRFSYRHSALSGKRVVAAVTLQLTTQLRSEIEAQMQSALAHRRKTHAVGGASAGSVFRNPDGAKAWELIDKAGMRGANCGAAQVSEVHCNFIINRGGATAQQIESLMQQVQLAVRNKSGVELIPEVHVVGETGDEG